MFNKVHDLNKEIEEKRIEMYNLAKEKGLAAHEVVNLSKELDHLLNKLRC